MGLAVAAALCHEAEPIEVSFGTRTLGAGFLLPLRDQTRVDRIWSACSELAARTELTRAVANPRLLRIDIAGGLARAFTVYGDCSACDRAWSPVLNVPLWGAKCRVSRSGVWERVAYGDLRTIPLPALMEKLVLSASILGFTAAVIGRAQESFSRVAALGWPQAISYAPPSSRFKLDVSATDAKGIALVLGALCAPTDTARIQRIARLVGGAFAYVSLAIDRSGTLDWRLYSRPLGGLDPEQILAIQDYNV